MWTPANTPWHDTKVEMLKSLWAAEEMSASQIAAEIGCTRNAVLGKAHRLGLASHALPPRPPAAPRRVPSPHGNSAQAQRLAQVTRPAPFVPKAADVQILETPFYKLARFECHYIPGEPSYDAPTCGHPVKEGSSYCPSHHAECWQFPRRRNITEEERGRRRRQGYANMRKPQAEVAA